MFYVYKLIEKNLNVEKYKENKHLPQPPILK